MCRYLKIALLMFLYRPKELLISIYQQLQIVGDISVEVSAPKKVQD